MGSTILRPADRSQAAAGQGADGRRRPRHQCRGEWALLHADEVVERHVPVEAACWNAAARYGIGSAVVLAREANLPRGANA